jgi:hypothetical protein
MERVEGHSEVLVVEQIEVVAPHLVHHHAVGVRVEAPRGDVDIPVVEEDPRVGSFRRRLAFARLLLDETRDRGDARVDRFVELAVHL